MKSNYSNLKRKNEIWFIPKDNFGNRERIEKRVKKVKIEDQASLKKSLDYLFSNIERNLRLKDRKKAEKYLSDPEFVVIRWLFTRTRGRLKKNYGMNSKKAAKKAQFRCKDCDESDVRTLQLDHVDGKGSQRFKCLCANCHQIKSRNDMIKKAELELKLKATKKN